MFACPCLSIKVCKMTNCICQFCRSILLLFLPLNLTLRAAPVIPDILEVLYDLMTPSVLQTDAPSSLASLSAYVLSRMLSMPLTLLGYEIDDANTENNPLAGYIADDHRDKYLVDAAYPSSAVDACWRRQRAANSEEKIISLRKAGRLPVCGSARRLLLPAQRRRIHGKQSVTGLSTGGDTVVVCLALSRLTLSDFRAALKSCTTILTCSMACRAAAKLTASGPARARGGNACLMKPGAIKSIVQI